MVPITIHSIFIGQPQEIADRDGSWTSAIFRSPVDGPVELTETGLAGDAVADTKHHGTLHQAVCCHPLAHYAFWNDFYNAQGIPAHIGPGGVGENWTLDGITEADICVGDIYQAGTARVQVSMPRFPCRKQERKLGLPDFLRQTVATRRTGFYLLVLTPGVVQAGDALTFLERPHPGLTLAALNDSVHRDLDVEIARQALQAPELAPLWHAMLEHKLNQ